VRDGCDKQYVTALDKHTGKTVWRTDRPPIDVDYLPYKKAFSTPLVVEVDGRPQMIIPGARRVIAYEPETGKPLWQCDYGNGFSNAPRPIVGHGMVYVCTGFAVPQLWAIRLGGRGNVSDTHVAWIERKQIPKRASPILVGDELYVVSDYGILSCLDARTGEMHWRERMPGNYSASPIHVEGRIYFFSHEGKTTVIQPGREFEILAENQLDGQIMATPAIAGQAMFLRTDTHLYRIE
jgi:outer membrane protein assembly factor BamB